MTNEFDRRFPKKREGPFLLYDRGLREEAEASYSRYSALSEGLDIIIVKLGSSVVKQSAPNDTNLNLLNLKLQFDEMLKGGYKLIIVTSGAKAFAESGTLAEGQKTLMEAHRKGQQLYQTEELLFDTRTIGNPEEAKAFANAALVAIKEGKVPYINASPSSFEEFPLDNSTATSHLTSALVGYKVSPLVVMLGQYPGLYSREGYKKQGPQLAVIRVVLNPKGIEYHIQEEEKSKRGTGGMQATVEVAKQLQPLGVETIITNGMAYQKGRLITDHKPLDAILQGRYVGTRFMPKQMW